MTESVIDVPDTYDAYAADADEVDPRFTDWLHDRAEPAWTDAVEHSFVRDLGDGTLPEAAFAEYLVQDAAFVDELAGAFGYAIGQAPDVAAKQSLVGFLETLTTDEDDYFERSFDALEVDESRRRDPELADPTAAFVDLLGRAAREGGYAETLAVLVPAEWIYREWATGLVRDGAGTDADGVAAVTADLPFYYGDWIELHATPSFREFVDWIRGQLDAAGPTLSPRRQRRVDALFRRTVDLEVAFFETAYAES